MKILTFADYYLPGFKAGGPIRTISAMVSQLPDEIEFLIVTRDRDHTDHHPYANVRTNEWTDVGRAKVLYLPKGDLGLARLVQLVHTVKPDVLYANSLFSRVTIRLLLAQRLGQLGTLPFVLAPRGEFSAGALRIRPGRKKAFLTLGKYSGLFRELLWQASTELEGAEIVRALGERQSVRVSRNIAIAPDIFDHGGDFLAPETVPKRSGSARFVFLSRVSPMKNLHSAIELVGTVSGEVSLDIFGPVDDRKYWQECQAAVAKVRPNVKVAWRGTVNPTEVLACIAGFDFFILPTLGENFGHVILESLSAGCPVLLSDRTSWGRLETDGAGWIMPLEQRGRWIEVLQHCVAMDHPSHQAMRKRATIAARRYDDRQSAVQQNVALFEEALLRR